MRPVERAHSFGFSIPPACLIIPSEFDRRFASVGSDRRAEGCRLSLRICVLGSGSRGNSTWVRTEKTRLLVDAGCGRKAVAARLSAVGECLDGCNAILVSHEHQDHTSGLRSLALLLKAPIHIAAASRDA